MLTALRRLGVETPNRSGLPIIEVPLRDHRRIDAVGRFLFDRGVYVTLAAYPLVPKDEVGFRIQLTALNTDEEVDTLIAALEELTAGEELRLREQELRGGGMNGQTAAARVSPLGAGSCSSPPEPAHRACTCSSRPLPAADR